MSQPAAPREVEVHGLRFDVAGMSEQGPRSENQDAYSIDAFARTGLVAVADGMGGERGGRIAADTALGALTEAAPIASLEEARRAVRQADAEVTRAAERDPLEREGMGCALGLLALVEPRGDGAGWVGAHVGDVRILSRAPDGTVRLETRDHTPAFARWEAGEISLDEIPDSAGANRLQRAVGRGGEADAVWLPARPGWSWLLISDGVYKVMRLDELGELMGSPSAAAGVEAIRRKVEERGPEDNFTAVLVRALGGPTAVKPAPIDRTEPMIRSNPAPRPAERSRGSVAATVLAVLALAAAALALWFAWQARAQTAERTEVERLRVEVDSLRAQVVELAEPFGPVAPPPTDTANPSPRSGVQR